MKHPIVGYNAVNSNYSSFCFSRLKIALENPCCIDRYFNMNYRVQKAQRIKETWPL